MPEVSSLLTSSCPARAPWAQLLFAHGAGADMDSDFMLDMDRRLTDMGIMVHRFNFPYMQKRLVDGKKRPPDRLPALQAAMLALKSELVPGVPLFVGGKSMGGRIAVTLVDALEAHGCVVFGYPFHPLGKPASLRLEPFEGLVARVRIIQGCRDSMGNRVEVSEISLPETVSVCWLEDGDHSLKPRKRSGLSYSEHLDTAARDAAGFMRAQL